MKSLVNILRGEKANLACASDWQGYQRELYKLDARSLKITKEVFEVLAKEIAPLRGEPEGSVFRLRNILEIAKPILETIALTNTPDEMRENLRRFLFGSLAEKQGLDFDLLRPYAQEAYNIYQREVKALKELQSKLAPEFDGYHRFYLSHLMGVPEVSMGMTTEEIEMFSHKA